MIPPSIRVKLAHAATAVLGQRLGVDLLVIKGPGMVPLAAYTGRASSDVDVLVRPDRLLFSAGARAELPRALASLRRLLCPAALAA